MLIIARNETKEITYQEDALTPYPTRIKVYAML